MLHAAHAAALDALFHLFAEGGAVAALERVFAALGPLAGAAGSRLARAATLHPREHARGLTDRISTLHLVEIPHRLAVTFRF